MGARDQLRNYIIETFLFGNADTLTEDSMSLIESGTIDSDGVKKLVSFLENNFSITISDEELVPDNLDSVTRLADFVSRKKPKMEDYNPATFWTTRYEHFDITSSGHRDLPLEYNSWLYKMKVGKIRKAALNQLGDFPEQKVLELGCGTGVYVEMWKQLGVKDLTGLDIAPNAIEQLQTRYPEYSFRCEDIGNKELVSHYGENQHDFVTAIGVLVHIIDEDQFLTAIDNMSRLTKTGGIVLISEYIVRSQSVLRPYMKLRSSKEFQEALKNVGLEIIQQLPMYYFMIAPFDTPSTLDKFFLPRINSLVRKMILRAPGLTGCLLYGIDSLITVFVKQGPSEKIYVCRKISG